MVSLAWIAEGARGTSTPIGFYASAGKGNDTVLRLLGQDVAYDPNDTGVQMHDAYMRELKDGARKLRLDYLREVLGLQTPHKRPTAVIPADALEWAHEVKKDLGERQIALLFPQTLWEGRTWPASHWVDLAWELHERNVAVVMMLAKEDERLKATPRFFWGFDLCKVAALMSLAALVIGNDSGPAHLSGTLGVPTIVTGGPTRGECVFGHIPEVIAMKSEDEPHCAGCHFQSPYRAACDLACQALYNLKPHIVFRRAMLELSLAAARPPRRLVGLDERSWLALSK